ncbi:hypothetical protein [Amycolatopsis aidingensis]|uniref:hypothetical protein n=1 Tax=Amycolatopsis aidingensis TaxID=2842453 RepID=UPI001C0E83C5|nr:hypothetical protein [Amycolatopsis aidingensis]
MDRPVPHRRPAVAFAGFALPVTLLLLTVLALRGDYLAGAGWRGGEYAFAFFAVATTAVLGGSALKVVPPRSPWRSFGTGLLLGGAFGFLAIAAFVAAVMIALSTWQGP